MPSSNPENPSGIAQPGFVQPGIAQMDPPAVADLSFISHPQLSGPVTASRPSRIVLTGFMGAGKTTVGVMLANRVGFRFLDADAEMEAATGATIAGLFAQHGEPWFREFEHQTIRRLLATESLVLALGGGAIEDARTRNLLLTDESTRLIHLEASLETVLERCRGTEPLRPILQDRTNLSGRYERRLPLYRQAHLNICVDSILPTIVVQTILDSI